MNIGKFIGTKSLSFKTIPFAPLRLCEIKKSLLKTPRRKAHFNKYIRWCGCVYLGSGATKEK
jgi:hypothetical protein